MLSHLPSLPARALHKATARIFAFTTLAFLAACDLALPGIGGDNSGQQIDPSAPVQVALLVPGGTGNPAFDQMAASLENAARMGVTDLNGARSIDLRIYNTARNPAQAAQMAAAAIADGAQIILGPLDAESANAVGTVGRDAIATSIQSNGGTVTGIESYTFSQQGIFSRAPAIAAAANSNGTQAVFVTDTLQGGLSILATSLDDQGLTLANTPLIGLARWDSKPQAAALPGLQNGLFAVGDAGREAAFSARYEATYGRAPHTLASIAYDGIAAIGALVATGDRNALTTSSLTRASGFAGATGIFRLLPNGTNQRPLAIARFQNNQMQIVDPAPSSFGRGGS